MYDGESSFARILARLLERPPRMQATPPTTPTGFVTAADWSQLRSPPTSPSPRARGQSYPRPPKKSGPARPQSPPRPERVLVLRDLKPDQLLALEALARWARTTIGATITGTEVRRMYRSLAKRLHPDMRVGTPAINSDQQDGEFHRLQELYEVLEPLLRPGRDQAA